MPASELCLGSHPLELLEKSADLVCVSGGVPLTIPFLQEAVRRRIQLSNDSRFSWKFAPPWLLASLVRLEKPPTALLGLMARKFFEMKQSPRHAWVGGNIGNPLIEHVTEMQTDDLVILELSASNWNS